MERPQEQSKCHDAGGTEPNRLVLCGGHAKVQRRTCFVPDAIVVAGNLSLQKIQSCAVRAAKGDTLSITRLKIGRVLEAFEVGRRCGASYR
jgi:hypothetical protein